MDPFYSAIDSLDDLIQAGGGTVTEEGLIRIGIQQMPFHWTFSAALPKPEDYILERSGTTVEDIYKAAEWESHRPHMPPPMVRDGGPVQPLSHTSLSMMPRNTPLASQDDTYAGGPRLMLNRKQRKAMAAKQRKVSKSSRNVLH